MTVDFDILKRNELRAAARLVGRAFEDYEYFTNYFPDLEERRFFVSLQAKFRITNHKLHE